jgi:uncharacterized cupin superfamily protein
VSPLSGSGDVGLKPGQALRVNRLPLPRAAVPEAQAGGGSPTVGHVRLSVLEGVEIGVWEMSEGTMYDVESDEVFVVTAGHAVVVIGEQDGHPVRTAELAPGTVMRLSAGMRTTWTVTEPLRKVYLSRPD